MADDPINQQQFEEDVAAAAGKDGFMNFGDPNGNYKMPSVEEVWKLIEQMDGISDEERAKIKESLYNLQDGSAQDFLKNYAQPTPVAHSSWDYMIFISMIVILLLIFALFGYKLYKSLMDKELKKQEKLKLKQSKKSKKAN